MLWLFVGPAGVYLLDFFCSGGSVLFAVESLSLLCLSFVSWFVCSREWCVGGLGGLSCGLGACVSWSASELGVGLLRRWAGFGPPVEYFAGRSRAVLFCGPFMLFLSCVCCAFVCVCLHVPCGHLLGKG